MVKYYQKVIIPFEITPHPDTMIVEYNERIAAEEAALKVDPQPIRTPPRRSARACNQLQEATPVVQEATPVVCTPQPAQEPLVPVVQTPAQLKARPPRPAPWTTPTKTMGSYPSDYNASRCKVQKVNLDYPEMNGNFRFVKLNDAFNQDTQTLTSGFSITRRGAELQDVKDGKYRMYLIQEERNVVLVEEPAFEFSYASDTTYGDPETRRGGYVGEMVARNKYDAAVMVAEATERAAMIEDTSHHKVWYKFQFADDVVLTNDVYSRGSSSEVFPLPVPFDLPDVTLGSGTTGKVFRGCAVPIMWKVAIDKCTRGLKARARCPDNLAGDAMAAMFGGGSPPS